jgi:hypothetical protein
MRVMMIAVEALRGADVAAVAALLLSLSTF